MADFAQVKLPDNTVHDISPHKFANTDTRNDNELPSYYMTNYKRVTTSEFKQCSKIGVNALITDTYCNLFTVVPWTDNSGGRPIQIAVAPSGKIAQRVATSDSAWGNWILLPNQDTTNTAGSTNNTSKLFLVGALEQSANPQTYSNSGVWVEGAEGRIGCGKMSYTNEAVTFSKSSGSWTYVGGEYTKSGQIVQARLQFKGGGSNVAVGSNAIVGTVNGLPLPPYTIRLQGYYSGTVLMGEYTTTGTFNIRILGQAINLSTSNMATVSGTFIIED